MIKILLVRHGQSESNNVKRLTGQIDSPLSELGVRQAQKVCDFVYKNYQVEAIYSSDLSRAVQTVEPLSKLTGLQVNKTDTLREINAGKWQGQKICELETQPLYKKWREQDLAMKTPGGESFLEVKERAKNKIEEIVKKHTDNTVVVCLHGGTIKMLASWILDIPPSRWKEIKYVSNASLTVIEYDGSYKLTTTFDDYLGDLSSEMPKGV